MLNDDQFEILLKLAHSGLIGAIWSAPPCRLYSSLRKNDGGPPPLRSKDFLDGLPSLNPSQLAQVEESKEIHRRSDILCIAVFQQGGFAAQEQPLNSLAWKEPSHQQFLSQCSCHFVATPACKWGLDIFKTWAIAATSDRISTLAGHCKHSDHMDFRGKRLPDGSFVSSITAEYPSSLASAIIDALRPWTSQSNTFNFNIAQWRNLLAKNPITRGPRITDGAGDNSSANWTIPLSNDHFQPLRQRWIKRILQSIYHRTELAPFLQDIRDSFPSCYSPRTLTRILLYFFKKEYPQVLFLRSNQQVFGHPIPNHLITSQIFKFVKIIGAVRTKTLQPRLCSYKMRLKMDSSRRSQIYNPLKLVGLLVLLLENLVWSTLTTEIPDRSLTPQFVG